MLPIIEVDKVSKSYNLMARRAHGDLRESITQGILSLFSPRGKPQMFSALDDISFAVNQGETLGIVGRNGAGKSTLLKILSRITEPTSGRVILRGRVASLLEVGTGFHPELSGRENIFLNGSLLGMSKGEVQSKLDEIVAFSEVGQFIDTPVKRYSSGMYVRLAFSIAAHIEPEILILDEVLAVGDASFQKKCLGKMGDITQAGRTILFVSHNMAAIKNFCSRAILLSKGRLIANGEPNLIIDEYLKDSCVSDTGEKKWSDNDDAFAGKELFLKSARIKGEDEAVKAIYSTEESINLEIEYIIHAPIRNLRMTMLLSNAEGVTVLSSTDQAYRPSVSAPGHYKNTCKIPAALLNTDDYTIRINATCPGERIIFVNMEALRFRVEKTRYTDSHFADGRMPGVVAPQLQWKILNGKH